MAIMERNRRGSKRSWLALAVAVAGMVALGIWLVEFHAPETSGSTDNGGQAVVLPVEPPTRSGGPLPPEPVRSAPTSSLAELTPGDVMGNLDCIMRSGTGQGRDMAVVLVPAEDGLRFAIVDGSGIVFSDKLPFHSIRHSSLARRPDGSVLAGFGGADPPSSVRAFPGDLGQPHPAPHERSRWKARARVRNCRPRRPSPLPRQESGSQDSPGLEIRRILC